MLFSREIIMNNVLFVKYIYGDLTFAKVIGRVLLFSLR